MLNEIPNNNDTTCVVNIVLKEVSNSNDAMCIGNNVHLTAIGAYQFSMAAMLLSCRKADLPEMRDSNTITIKVHEDGNKLYPGKE